MYATYILRSMVAMAFFFSLAETSFAQEKIIDHSFNTWWSNINAYRITENWYLSSELHIRRAKGLNDWQQFLFRPAINYQRSPHVTFTTGYTYILSYPYGEQPITTRTPESNIWEQLTLKHQLKNGYFMHRYRLEQRFIGIEVPDKEGHYHKNGHKFAQRFRYRFTASVNLSKNGQWFAKGFDELWLNLDNNFMPLSYNQNWLYAGIGYHFSKKGTFELGYLNQAIRKSDGLHFENNHTVQLSIGYKFGSR